tara:strand:+ start:2875 stop:4404 length:1530 start_codon:yes stop_codon:yes gene_type:complete
MEKQTKLKHNNIFTCILISFLFSIVFAQEKIPNGLEERIEKICKDWNIPGMAVAIIKNDKVIYANGFGVRELGKSAKVDEKTLFAVGSTTKAMTVATLGMLVDEKKLSWNDRVIDMLPGFRMYDSYATNEMTVRDLLSHKSGLTRGDQVWYASPMNQQEIMEKIRYLKPEYSFRSKYHYQNLMYLTAGILSAKIHGEDWDKIMYKRFFKPLKMRSSVTNLEDLEKRNNVATPHNTVDGKFQPIEDRNLDNISPAGSVYSNVLEMSNWIRLNMNKGMFEGRRILSEEVMEEMHTPQMHGSYTGSDKVTNFSLYGLGWRLSDYRGYKMVSHGGGIDGFITWTGFISEIDLGWVVFNNAGMRASYSVGREIIDAFLGKEDDIDWSEKDKKSYDRALAVGDSIRKNVDSRRVLNTQLRLKNSGYEGDYNDDFYGRMTVSSSGNDLILSRGNALKGTLSHWHYDTFRVRWDHPRERGSFGNEFISFHFSTKNEVVSLERLLDGKPRFFWKEENE